MIGHLPAIGVALLGVALAGIMVACQVYFVPPAVHRDGLFQDQLSVIDPHSAPLVGPPDASLRRQPAF